MFIVRTTHKNLFGKQNNNNNHIAAQRGGEIDTTAQNKNEWYTHVVRIYSISNMCVIFVAGKIANFGV